MSWKLFEDPPKPGTRFVALYSDGSGGSVYLYDEQEHLMDAMGEDMFERPVSGQEIEDWLFDAGYLYWAALPEGGERATNNDWRRMVTDPPKAGTRFVVLLNNLKAAMVFVYSENKRLIDSTGNDFFGRRITKIDLANWLFSARLQCWMPLPDEMKLFFEEVGE